MNQEQQQLEENLKNAQDPIAIVDAKNALSYRLIRTDVKRAITLAKEAKALATDIGYKVGQANAAHIQSRHYFSTGDYKTALNTANEALAKFEFLDNKEEQAKIRRVLGSIHSVLGSYTTALNFYVDSLEFHQSSGDSVQQARDLFRIGILYSNCGNFKEAIECYERSIELCTLANENDLRARILNSCCVDYTNIGNYDLAMRYGEESLKLATQVSNTYCMAVTQSSLGEVDLAQGNYQAAITNFELSLRTLSSRQYPIELSITMLNLGKAHLFLGNLDKAFTYITDVLSHAESQNMVKETYQAHRLLSQIYEKKGDLPSALDHLRRYAELSESVLAEKNQRDLQNLQILNEVRLAQKESERQRSLREEEQNKFERINQLRDQFLQSATHDIKNPLSAINNTIYFLERHGTINDEKGEEYLSRITNQVDKIRQLIDEVLEFTQMETVSILDKEPVNLAEWFNELQNEFSTSAKMKQISLLPHISPQNLVVTCDKKRLERAFNNLLSNAIKYTPNGGYVIFKAEKLDSHIQIQIVDNGIGIPSKALPHLFDPFYRVEEHADQIEGTGLGLGIAKLGVEQHNGTIVVESEVHKGTTFTISLPI